MADDPTLVPLPPDNSDDRKEFQIEVAQSGPTGHRFMGRMNVSKDLVTAVATAVTAAGDARTMAIVMTSYMALRLVLKFVNEFDRRRHERKMAEMKLRERELLHEEKYMQHLEQMLKIKKNSL